MPGITIIVNKPEGKFVTDRLHRQFYSSLPEDHYAEWMRNNVGRQGWDWDWAWYSGKLTWGTPDVAIKFRKGKELFATQASLMWG